MINNIKFIFFLFLFNFSYSQSIITIDADNLEFIEDVNYHLFLNKVKVYSSVCDNNKITIIPSQILYDSITFSKINYTTVGLRREKISKTILLSKNIINLDEVVITTSNKQDIIIGEKNRFVKRMSNSIIKGLDYGIAIQNKDSTDLKINKVVFFIDKIKYKTAYKINFYEFNEVPINIGHQKAKIGNLLYSTDILYLEPKQKDAVEVNLDNKINILKGKYVFVSLELIGNYDENNNEIKVNFKESSKIKFQISNQANYYAKMALGTTGKLTSDLININAMINYDFAYQFYSKPHKSNIVAPAILVYTSISE